MQDRDGALLVLNRRTRRFFPFIKCIFADAAYQGPKTAAAIAKTGTWKLEIVRRDELHRFLVLPKRWIVERTLAWISHNRRLARDFERYTRSAAAFIRLAMIRIMLRRAEHAVGRHGTPDTSQRERNKKTAKLCFAKMRSVRQNSLKDVRHPEHESAVAMGSL